jgi:ribonuclease R
MAPKTIEGIIKKHRDGFGFLVQPKGTEDVYLPAEELAGVMDGDRIEVEMVRRRGRSAGRLVRIVERGRRHLVGTYRPQGRQGWVEPSDPALHQSVMVRVACDPAPKSGQKVKVALTEWPTAVTPAKGEVVAVLGDAGDPIHDVLSMAYARGFSDSFPADVMAESEAMPARVGVGDFAARRDLRNLPLVTIDGEDARDFDDAVFVERVPGGGYRLVVAIADVVHYVREGTALDREALSRGTSVYFPHLVLPMLPERLSNGICSLRPDEDRLCMVADLTMTAEGKTVNTEIYEAVMRSHARLTYDEVAAMMADAGLAEAPEDAVPIQQKHRFWQARHMKPAVDLSRKLNRRRLQRGTIDFDLPEPYVVLDEGNQPVAIKARERLWPHRLVEEFMLAANEAVAYFFHLHGLPTIYRIHDEPDELKLASFATLARAHGFALSAGDDIPSKKINDFLHSLAGRPEQRTLNQLLLRAMQQAIYSSENIGHYGLAAPHYLHFTSPIRRYPDLMVHRLLKEHWARAGLSRSDDERERAETALERVASQASERERAAVEAEREADDYFACLYMQDKVGETFEANVASVAAFGLFVQLEEAHLQGLVKAESLGRGAEFDEQRMRMVVRGSGRSFSVGDAMTVVCVEVNLARRQITFAPEGVEAGAAEDRRGGGRRERSLAEAVDALKGKRRGKGGGRGKAAGGKKARTGRGGRRAAGSEKSGGTKSAGKAGTGRGGKKGAAGGKAGGRRGKRSR